jgi:uncharacterized lipoprotein YajG
MLRALFILAAMTAIAACSSKSADEEAADKAAAQAQAAAAHKTVLDPQLRALQKAKDVQKTVDDAAKATDKAIDDNGG